ncbi:ATP-binding cassette domain-containing protein [Microbacterium gorillae]|uniref:ATP-binding cassette domain-containing protein n=1 Tax=Microbacterium gorillae TaxID=1231063 RepID=UPI00059115DF|nr:ABC transporter ATP-binding protein [Microbacterium gorillae]
MSGIAVRNLTLRLGERTLIDSVSLAVAPGEVLALVGESGAGKSLLLRSLLGMAPTDAAVSAQELAVDGVDLRAANERRWRTVRGARAGLVMQDALGALDPVRRVGAEVAEPLVVHTTLTRADRAGRVQALLTDVGMPEPAVRARQRPHELSGGLRQRAVIATALAADPPVLLMDEPTTALDATVQRRVLALVRSLADGGRAVLVVSHDLAAVSLIADRIAVMRDGRILESGPVARMLTEPEHPYTRELLDAARRTAPTSRAVTAAVPVLSAAAVTRRFGDRIAVDAVSVDVRPGSMLGVVGESGSGKTTLARLLLGADTVDAGEVRLDGELWNPLPERRRRARRRGVQLVSQNPRAAFNPTWTLRRSLAEALASVGVPRGERAGRIAELAARVELDAAVLDRRPRAVSGGQLQRAAIARALATGPRVLVLDEPLSALDVSVGARILTLLERLRDEGLAMVLISHDLRVVGQLADEVVVMRGGAVIERGPTAEVFAAPQHAFTRELLAAAASRT